MFLCGVGIIWANDIDKNAANAYTSIFKDVEFVQDDIYNIKNCPSADILIGCHPCTGFSQAAKRKWKYRSSRDLLDNPKNFLFKEFVRAIKQVKPKFIFVENVKGMLSASNGYFFNEQIQALKNLGFEQIHHEVLNAASFGVAQTRERLFIVGIHKSVATAAADDFNYAFPKPSHGLNNKPYVSMKEVIAGMPDWPTGEFLEIKFHGHFLTRNRKRKWSDPSYTIVANGSHVPLHPKGEPMRKVGKDTWILQGEFNRRLSYKECLKIQGLPEEMALPDNIMTKYMVIGNAVPPKLAEQVFRPVTSAI